MHVRLIPGTVGIGKDGIPCVFFTDVVFVARATADADILEIWVPEPENGWVMIPLSCVEDVNARKN